MNDLPPLPLIDNCLFVDNTGLEYVMRCSRSAEYFLLRKRRLAEDKAALNFGAGMHVALEFFYRAYAKFGGPRPDTENKVTATLRWFFGKNPQPIDDYRQFSLADGLMRYYGRKYVSEDFTVLKNHTGAPLIEMPFACKLADIKTSLSPLGYITLYWSGRVDLTVERNKELFNIDHKTSSIMGSSFFMEQSMSAQHEGYMWSVQQCTGLTLAGYMVNGIRPRPPAKTDRGRPPVIDEDFQREWVYVPQARLEEWKQNTLAVVDEFLWMYERGFFPQKKVWCVGKYGPCQYYDVCNIPREQRLLMLASGVFRDNDWSPLVQPTQAKA